MVEQEFCQGCIQKHDCQKIYQRLGETEGPSVVMKVIAAFLLPMVVFIVALVAFEEILAGAKGLQTALSFLLALSVTFISILIIKAVNRQLGKNK